MATKPTQTVEWSKDFNFTTGLFPGTPTKLKDPLGATQGSIPGEGIVAQFHNANLNVFGLWSEWELAGSNVAKLEAYPVETDAKGTTGISALSIGGTASDDIACVIEQNTAAPTAALDVTNTGIGFGITASVLGDSAAIKGTSQTNTGPTIEAICLGLGDGIRGQANSGTGVSGVTVSGTAGSFEATGTGVGVQAISDDGYGITASSNTRAPLNLVPEVGNPPNTDEGDLFFDSLSTNLGFGRAPNENLYVWGTTHGFTKGYNQDIPFANVTVLELNGPAMALNSPYEPRDPFNPGFFEITIEFTARSLGPAQVITYELRDITGGGDNLILTSTVTLQAVGLGDSHICRTRRFFVSTSGSKIYRVLYKWSGIDYQLDNQILKGIGQFDGATS